MEHEIDANQPSIAPSLGGSEPAEPEVTTADSTEAPAEAEGPSHGVGEMSKDERREWLATGKMPDRDKKASDAPADSSTAPAKDQKAAEIAAKGKKAASEPAAPAKDKPKARNAEENRVAELLEDRRRERERADLALRRATELETRLAALEKSKTDGKEDSSTKADATGKAKASFKDLREQGAPDINDFDDPNEWAAAVIEFAHNRTAQELTTREQQAAEAARFSQEVDQVITMAVGRLEKEEQAFPHLKEQVDPGFRKVVPARLLPKGEQLGPHHVAKDFIAFEMDHPLQLSAFYSTPEGQAEWSQIMQMRSARDIERTIARRDLSFGLPKSQGEGTGEGKKPAPKTFTKTPPPPAQVGPKGAAAADKAESAVKSGDFETFRAELDAREGVQRQYGRRRSA